MSSMADVDGSPELAAAALSWQGSATLKSFLPSLGLTLPSWLLKSLHFPTPEDVVVHQWIRHVVKEFFGEENVDLAILCSWEQNKHGVSCCLC